MFTNLQSADIKDSSRLFMESRMCVFSKEGILYFIKGKGSRSDLQLAVSGWKNKVMDTESDGRFVGNGP